MAVNFGADWFQYEAFVSRFFVIFCFDSRFRTAIQAAGVEEAVENESQEKLEVAVQDVTQSLKGEAVCANKLLNSVQVIVNTEVTIIKDNSKGVICFNCVFM